MADEPKTPDNDEEPSAADETPTADSAGETSPPINDDNAGEQVASEQPAESAPAGGEMDQAELDALMAQMNEDKKDESPADNDASTPEAEPSSAAAAPDQPAPEPESTGTSNTLDQAELDALTAQLGGQDDSTPATAAPATAGNTMDQAELDALVSEISAESNQPESGGDSLEAEMAAAIAAEAAGEQPAAAATAEPDTSEPAVVGETPVKVSPADANQYAAPELDNTTPADFASIDLLDDVQLDVKIELGRTDMYIEDVLRLGAGSVVELDKLAGDPVDIFVNERLVARGEVLVLNDNFCVRINDIHSPVPEHEEC